MKHGHYASDWLAVFVSFSFWSLKIRRFAEYGYSKFIKILKFGCANSIPKYALCCYLAMWCLLCKPKLFVLCAMVHADVQLYNMHKILRGGNQERERENIRLHTHMRTCTFAYMLIYAYTILYILHTCSCMFTINVMRPDRNHSTMVNPTRYSCDGSPHDMAYLSPSFARAPRACGGLLLDQRAAVQFWNSTSTVGKI